MAKTQYVPKSKKISICLICFFLIFIGWELHVFKLWVSDIMFRAKLCDETNCVKINKLAKELDNYELPVKRR
jgi:hypothetical protein